MGSGPAPSRSLKFQEFEVRLSRAERDQYLVEVLRSPAGESKAPTKLPIDRKELHTQLAELRLPFTEKSQLVEMGQVLYDFLFVPPIARCWTASLGHAQGTGQGLNFRMRIEDSELAQLPWELVYDRSAERFLIPSLRNPLSRYIPMPEAVLPVSISLPLRLLLAISSPPNHPPLDIEREKQWIMDALTPLFKSNAVSIDVLAPATRQNLQTWLRRDYHVLHYIGHGYVSAGTGAGHLLLTDEATQRGSAQDAETLGYLVQSSSLRLVFLNACQTAVAGGTEVFLGVAQSMVRAGLPAVVAMQFDMPDTSAAIFARAFYASLADGFPVQAAVTEGRKAVLAAVGSDLKDWATPALFMRSPTGVLFMRRSDDDTQADPAEHNVSSPIDTSGGEMHPTSTQLRLVLRILVERFDLEELRDLCFNLEVDFDNLRGEGKSSKARELLTYLERRGQTGKLIQRVRELRPDFSP